MALSENEKAATFLGWEPRIVRCANPEHDHEPFEHPSIPPDMGRPENYMRALVVVSQKHHIEMVLAGAACDITIFKDSRTNRHILAKAERPVEALAALYDVEHPEG